VHEEGVICTRRNDADLVSVLGVPVSKTVKDVESAASVEVVNGALTIDAEDLRAELDIDAAPPNVVGRGRLVYNTLVERRAAGLCTGEGSQGAGGENGRAAFVVEGLFVQLTNTGVAEDNLGVDADVGQDLRVGIVLLVDGRRLGRRVCAGLRALQRLLDRLEDLVRRVGVGRGLDKAGQSCGRRRRQDSAQAAHKRHSVCLISLIR